MGYLIFRGVSTNSLTGVYVSKMPSHKKAGMRFTEYYVRGRDGALHVDDGLSNFDIQVGLTLVKTTADRRYLVNAWADGTGRLISSDDLTRAYLATVKDEIKWTRVDANDAFYDTAQITFNCQPYMVEAVESTFEHTGEDVYYFDNQGSAVSYPKLVVTGNASTSSFSINGDEIVIDGMQNNRPVTIDCETGYVYTSRGAKSLTGEIPRFELGQNSIGINSGISKIVVTPRWRWI